MKREITINEILKMLRAHIKLIIIITLVGGILAYAYSAYMITPMYSTSTLLYVTNSEELPGDSAITSSTDNTDSSEVQKSGSNDIIISSRIAQVCTTLFKTDLMMSELIEYLDLSLSPGQLKGMISITASEDTQFLHVNVTGTEPETAAKIANAFPAAAQDLYKLFFPYGQIIVADKAGVPTTPSSPDIKKNTLFGLAGGLVLSVLLALFLEVIDTTVKPGDDLYKMYGIPVFAGIVDIESEGKGKGKKK